MFESILRVLESILRVLESPLPPLEGGWPAGVLGLPDVEARSGVGIRIREACVRQASPS